MSDAEKKKQAWNTALRMLAASPKSRWELHRKLREKGYPGEIIDQTLNLLEEKKILDDRIYTANLLQRLQSLQPSGRQRIAFELKRRGIPTKIQEEVLSTLDPDREIQNARELAWERWQRFENLHPEKRKKKVYECLVRRGFDFGTARELIDEFEGGEGRQESQDE